MRLSPLKDLSPEQLVTGRVHKMLINTRMLGTIPGDDPFLKYFRIDILTAS